MDDQVRQEEFKRLEIVLEQIKKQLGLSEEACGIKQSELKNTLLNYWELFSGNSTDEAQLLETANRQHALFSIIHKTPLKLRKMLSSPYFGRIDFAEEAENQCESQVGKVYVGISNLMNESEFLVYDWRAPISGMFYDFGLGKAWYNSPEGIISGDIMLKRQYKIVGGCIQYMFDADLKIDDEILQEILGKSVDDKMHTIVNSIQREQNQIIRDENYRALFVEGPAGSGKTSIALHRIAFLLYRDRDSINEKNVLILSPNHLFSDYISNVLPEIGEENVLQMTFQDYVSRSIAQFSIDFEHRTSHLESILSSTYDDENATRAANIRFKSSRDFELAMQDYLNWIEISRVDNYPDIEFRGQIIFGKEEWKHYYLDSLSSMPVTLRLDKIKRVIQIRMRPFVHKVREEKEAEIIAKGEEVNERIIKALARICAKREFSSLVGKIEQLTSLNPLVEYRRLFEDNRMFEQFLSKRTFPKEWQAIRKHTLLRIDDGILPYEDVPPFLYFQGILQGYPVRRDIKHLVIDEAQDYTILQFKILTMIFPNSTWTVVGDSAQSIHPFLDTPSFKEMSEIIGIEKSHTFCLTRSYRSTKQIQAFCQAMLSEKIKVEPINRLGPLPKVIRIENVQNLVPALIDTIESILNEGWHSIGIICKNMSESIQIFSAIKDRVNLNLIIEEDDEFHRGIVVIPSYLAKGLEFDGVLVINADASNYSRDEERHILYTVCTRSLHRLSLFYVGVPSPFLREIDKNLYQTV